MRVAWEREALGGARPKGFGSQALAFVPVQDRSREGRRDSSPDQSQSRRDRVRLLSGPAEPEVEEAGHADLVETVQVPAAPLDICYRILFIIGLHFGPIIPGFVQL